MQSNPTRLDLEAAAAAGGAVAEGEVSPDCHIHALDVHACMCVDPAILKGTG